MFWKIGQKKKRQPKNNCKKNVSRVSERYLKMFIFKDGFDDIVILTNVPKNCREYLPPKEGHPKVLLDVLSKSHVILSLISADM